MALFNRVESSSVKEIENGLFEARDTFIDRKAQQTKARVFGLRKLRSSKA
ncbi:hypothetical protein [Desulfosporosinus fructosivorans]|nr:hypothetical protein [Desulfosporosinus fructosivorans]